MYKHLYMTKWRFFFQQYQVKLYTCIQVWVGLNYILITLLITMNIEWWPSCDWRIFATLAMSSQDWPFLWSWPGNNSGIKIRNVIEMELNPTLIQIWLELLAMGKANKLTQHALQIQGKLHCESKLYSGTQYLHVIRASWVSAAHHLGLASG